MFVSLDLETTGFSSENDQIIEFGAIKFDLDGNSETLSFLVNPHKPIPEIVTYITNITDEDVKDAVNLEDKKQEILDFIGDLPIVGHNIQFDTGFLRAKGFPLENPEYDTQVFAGILLPKMPSYSLEVISEELGLTHEEKHRALDDAIAAKELFVHECNHFRQLDKETQQKYLDLANKSDWPGKNLFKHLITLAPLPNTASQHHSTPFPELETNASAILEEKPNQAFEEIPPFKHLIKEITNQADADVYISVPPYDFNETEDKVSDSVATIDEYSNYISLERLNKFQNKEHFETDEITSLLKYLNWLSYTHTGLLSEVPLYGKEKNTIQQINVDSSIEDPTQATFIKKALQKDENAAALCTHRYINSHAFNQEHELILFNLPKFIHALRKNISVYQKKSLIQNLLLNIKNISDHPIIDQILDQLDQVYQQIDKIFGGPDLDSPYLKRVNIEISTRDLAQWQKCQHLIRQIVQDSKTLGEIKSLDNLPYLVKYKSFLGQLVRYFSRENYEKTLSWIEQKPDQEIILRSIPTDIITLLDQKFSEFKSVKIIDESLKLCPYLPAQFPIKDLSTPADNITIKLISDLDNKQANSLETVLDSLKGKTALVCSSKRMVQAITLHLFNKNKPALSQLTGSRSKLLQKFQKSQGNTPLIINANTWIDFNLHDQIDNLIIDKVPFDPPNSPEIQAQSKGKENPFMEVQLPRAVAKLKKVLGRLRGKRPATAYILDPRITKSRYGEAIIEELKKIGRVEE